jgi:hypothetical protein
MRRYLLAIPLAALLTVSAAAPRQTPTVTRFEITLSPGTADQVKTAAAVLMARFEEFRLTPSSTITRQISGRTITFEFHADAVNESEISFVGTAQGILRFAAEDSPQIVWASDLDLDLNKEVGPIDPPGEPVRLLLWWKPAAAARLKRITSTRIGTIVRVTLDGKVLTRLKLAGAIESGGAIEIDSVELGVMLSIVLNHGRLPMKVDSYRILAAR